MSNSQHEKIEQAISKATAELNNQSFKVDENKGAKQAIEEANANSRKYARELLSKTLHELFG